MDLNDKLTNSLKNFADQLAELKSNDERLNWLRHFFDRLRLVCGKDLVNALKHNL